MKSILLAAICIFTLSCNEDSSDAVAAGNPDTGRGQESRSCETSKSLACMPQGGVEISMEDAKKVFQDHKKAL